MEFRVISIGTLGCHELWGEQVPVRTAHATTTLVRSRDRVIVVDPGLPAQALSARLRERSGIDPSAVTDVFLTTFRPAHRRGLSAFGHARWHISQTERESVGAYLVEQLQKDHDPDTQRILRQELAVLKQCTPAPDRLADQVDLFPLPGFTPGTCGIVLGHMNWTALLAGDAVATAEHLEQGRVLRGCYDAAQARESFLEALEIADVIVPGHDNMLMNLTRRPIVV